MPPLETLSRRKAWLLAARPATLGASIVPVLVGLALASRSVAVDPIVAVATIGCALLLQIATNLANDYYDFQRGIDTAERLGPVRVTQAGLLTPETVRNGLLCVLVAASALGAWLVSVGGWPIFAIGASALVAAVAYSAGPRPLASLGLGEVLVFVFFGFCAVAGTHRLQGASFGAVVALAGYPVAALAAAIIVVNNLRDIPTDTAAGKHTLAVRLGVRGTRNEYTLLVVSALAAVAALAWLVTGWLWIVLAAVPPATREVAAVWQRSGADLNCSLIGTAKLHALVGMLVALGLLL